MKTLASVNHPFLVGLQSFHPHIQDMCTDLNILELKLEFISRNWLRFSSSFFFYGKLSSFFTISMNADHFVLVITPGLNFIPRTLFFIFGRMLFSIFLFFKFNLSSQQVLFPFQPFLFFCSGLVWPQCYCRLVLIITKLDEQTFIITRKEEKTFFSLLFVLLPITLCSIFNGVFFFNSTSKNEHETEFCQKENS